MIVGRKSEKARFDRLVEELQQGHSKALALVGEPGIGKTVLLDYLATCAHDLRVVRVSGFEMEQDLAFAGLSGILADFIELIPQIPTPQASALSAALGTGPPVPADRFLAYAGALSLLAEAALPGPLLVIVDDAHWMDGASLDALTFCARRIAAEGIGLVFASRFTPDTMVERAAGIETLHIEGLSTTDGVELLAAAPSRVSGEVARKLVEDCAGNPLALGEVRRSLSDRQLLGVDPLPIAVPLGDALAAEFGGQVQGMPPDTRWALLIAAAGAGDASLVTAALALESVVDSLAPAEDAGLVGVDEGSVTFRHPLVRSGVYRSAPSTERRKAHGVLARAAKGRIETAARHRAAAAPGPDEDVASDLHAASQLAASRLGFSEAAQLMERAATLSPDPGTAAARHMEAGQMAMLAGQAQQARDAFDAAIRDATDNALRDTAQAARAQVELWTGNVQNALDMLLTAAQRAEAKDAGAAAMMYVDAVVASDQSMTAAQGLSPLDLAERAVAQPNLPAPVAAVAAAYRVAMRAERGRASHDEIDSTVSRFASMLEAASADAMLLVRTASLMHVFHWAWPSGGSAPARALAQLRALGAPSLLPYPLVVRARGLWLSGNIDGALAFAAEAFTLAMDTGQFATAGFVREILARIAAARGDDHASGSHLQRMIDDARTSGCEALDVFARNAHAFRHLTYGRHAEAVAEGDRAVGVLRDADARSHVQIQCATDLVEAAVAVGDASAARRGCEFLATCDLAGYALTQGAVERCEGLIESDPTQAVAHFTRAIALEEQARAPFEAARSRLLMGERLLTAGLTNQARPPLEAAFATFDRVRATPWADRAARALAHTDAAPTRPRTPTPALTSQELQVANAAAVGLTNKEIAAQLYLSVKTVEFHLGNAYKKVGVRNRTGLARHLRGEPTPNS